MNWVCVMVLHVVWMLEIRGSLEVEPDWTLSPVSSLSSYLFTWSIFKHTVYRVLHDCIQTRVEDKTDKTCIYQDLLLSEAAVSDGNDSLDSAESLNQNRVEHYSV